MTSIALLRPANPGVYDTSVIYNPANPTGSGQVVPAVSSLVLVSGQIFVVTAVDPVSLASTLTPAYTELEPSPGSVISYGNDVFHLYYDTRVTPNVLTVEQRCVILGGDPAYYQIVRYPNTPTAVVISQYYGVAGNYISNTPPMLAVNGVTNTWSFSSCVTNQTLVDNEILLLQVYNSSGALITTVSIVAKLTSVVNASTVYQPRITSIAVVGTQALGQTSFFVYTRQSLAALFLNAQLTYDDGTTATVLIDNVQCFLYGTEDFIASYPGLVQTLLLKYYLSPGELTSNTLNPLNGFISTTVTITVLPHPAQLSGKISVIPIWNSATSAYGLRYYYYTLNRNASVDITAFVSISTGSFNGSIYGPAQNFTLSVDLNLVNPSAYTTSTIYTQNVQITLQPIAALVRYIIQDSPSSVYAYGQDSSVSRRPVLYFDTTLVQGFIPITVFGDVNAFLLSFYINSNPQFDITQETQAPTPTHFLIRDPTTGAMLIPAMLPITSYATPFNITNGANYIKSTILVEFIQQIGGQNLILQGVPVDVYAGTYVA